jgi:hypothetical protein
METCTIAAKKWKNSFTYTLFDERELDPALT